MSETTKKTTVAEGMKREDTQALVAGHLRIPTQLLADVLARQEKLPAKLHDGLLRDTTQGLVAKHLGITAHEARRQMSRLVAELATEPLPERSPDAFEEEAESTLAAIRTYEAGTEPAA